MNGLPSWMREVIKCLEGSYSSLGSRPVSFSSPRSSPAPSACVIAFDWTALPSRLVERKGEEEGGGGKGWKLSSAGPMNYEVTIRTSMELCGQSRPADAPLLEIGAVAMAGRPIKAAHYLGERFYGEGREKRARGGCRGAGGWGKANVSTATSAVAAFPTPTRPPAAPPPPASNQSSDSGRHTLVSGRRLI